MSNTPATQDDIHRLEGRLEASHNDIMRLDGRLEHFEIATKKDVLRLEGRIDQLERNIERIVGDVVAAAIKTMQEYFADMFRGADDRTKAVADRVTVVERRVDEHVGDASVHRAPRKRRAR